MDWIIDGLALAVMFLPFAFMFPSCTCCGLPCIFFSDAAPTDDADWDDLSGILVANHTNPEHELGTKYTFDAEPDTTTDTVYFHFDLVDASNYHRVSLVSNGTNGTLQIHKVTAGTPVQVGTNLTVTGWNGSGTVTIEVCWTPPIGIVATVLGFQRSVVSDEHGGEEFGLSGNATFTNFEAQVLREDCDDCAQSLTSCGACATNTVPSALAIKLTGVVSDRCDAANLNDIWFVATRTNCASVSANYCGDGETADTLTAIFRVTMPAAVRDACDPATGPGGALINFNSLDINLYGHSGTDDWKIHVIGATQSSASYDQFPIWRATWINQSTAPDCTTIEGVVCSYVCDSANANPSDESYDFTGSTATVSVL